MRATLTNARGYFQRQTGQNRALIIGKDFYIIAAAFVLATSGIQVKNTENYGECTLKWRCNLIGLSKALDNSMNELADFNITVSGGKINV
jgi:hypothetical protein